MHHQLPEAHTARAGQLDKVKIILQATTNQELLINRITITAMHVRELRMAMFSKEQRLKVPIPEIQVHHTVNQEVHPACGKLTAPVHPIPADQVLLWEEVHHTALQAQVQAQVTALHPEVLQDPLIQEEAVLAEVADIQAAAQVEVAEVVQVTADK
jgi:hypothetical protein